MADCLCFWQPPLLGPNATKCLLALVSVGISTAGSLGVWGTRVALVVALLYCILLGEEDPREMRVPSLEALLPRGEKSFYRLAAGMPTAAPAAEGLRCVGEAVSLVFSSALMLVATLPAWGGSLLPGTLAALLSIWAGQCGVLCCPRNPYLMAHCRKYSASSVASVLVGRLVTKPRLCTGQQCDDITAAAGGAAFRAQTALLMLVLLGFGLCMESGALSETAFVVAVAAHGSANLALRASLGLWAGGRGGGLLIGAEQQLLGLSLACAAAIWWLSRDVPSTPSAEAFDAVEVPGDGLVPRLLSLCGVASLGADLRAGDLLLALYLCVTAAIATRATLAGVRWEVAWLEEADGVRRPVGGAYVLCKDTKAARVALDRATPLGVVLSAVGWWGRLDPG